MKKIYVFLANGFEEIEAISVVDILRRANMLAVTCSIGSHKEVSGAHGITVTADLLFDETDFNDADMLVLPGGMPGTSNLNNHVPLKELIVQHRQKGKALAAICAAPMILGNLNLLKGIEANCYPGFEEMLKGAILSNQKVVESNSIITANGPGVAIDFALKIIEYFKGKDTADEVADSVYKYVEH